MKQTVKHILRTLGIGAVVITGMSVVYAGPANPIDGYISVHDNIVDKGANYGRCNALGSLAAKVCTAEGVLIPAIQSGTVDQCHAMGVDLATDPAVAPCLQPLSCEQLNTC